jgi:hypothetical protein
MTLPPDAVAYRRTAQFSEATIPPCGGRDRDGEGRESEKERCVTYSHQSTASKKPPQAASKVRSLIVGAGILLISRGQAIAGAVGLAADGGDERPLAAGDS